jgi:hypothetical protein
MPKDRLTQAPPDPFFAAGFSRVFDFGATRGADEILAELCRAAEAIEPAAVAAIVVLDRENERRDHAIAPTVGPG